MDEMITRLDILLDVTRAHLLVIFCKNVVNVLSCYTIVEIII